MNQSINQWMSSRCHSRWPVVVPLQVLFFLATSNIQHTCRAMSMATTAREACHRPTRLVWHRRDLRLHDNELYHANDHAESLSIASVYVVNPDDFVPRKKKRRNIDSDTSSSSDWYHCPLVGPHAARVLVESLQDLQRRLDGSLIIARGDPVDIIPRLADELGVRQVWWSEEPGHYEGLLSTRMRDAFLFGSDSVSRIGIRTVSGYTLYHPNDLPYGDATWSALARPKETKSKKKPKRQQQQQQSGSSLPGQHNRQRDDNLDQPLRDLVDVSMERWAGMPRIMGDFRRAARTYTQPRPCLGTPAQSVLWNAKDSPLVTVGHLPTLQELTDPSRNKSLMGLPTHVINTVIDHAISNSATPSSTHSDNNHSPLVGGETEGLARLQSFVEDGHAAVAVRNLADVSDNNSARISAYLALGALSPRQVVQTAKQHNVDWLISHMTMRDFFLYSCHQQGPTMFALHNPNGAVHKSNQRRKQKKKKQRQRQKESAQKGSNSGGKGVNGNTCDPTKATNESSDREPDNETIVWKSIDDNMEVFERWVSGTTGLPLVDAGMRELQQTGYTSNRVRQNVASLLTKDLKLDWRAGAEWMQFCLEDHCVGANWGNWRYFGGVGADPKNRHFRTVSQAIKYDVEGRFVQKWLPKELGVSVGATTATRALFDDDDADTDTDTASDKETTALEALWRPWDFRTDWPIPIVDPSSQYVWEDKQRLEETGSLVSIVVSPERQDKSENKKEKDEEKAEEER